MPYSHLALEERYVIYHLVLYGLSYVRSDGGSSDTTQLSVER